MQTKKSKCTIYVTQGNKYLELPKTANDKFCEVVIESEKAINDKNLNIKEHQVKISDESEVSPENISGIDASENKRVHFVASKYVCSKKCETLHAKFDQLANFSESKCDRSNSCCRNLNTETIEKGTSPRTQESTPTDEVKFCCGNLNHSGVVSAKFSMFISLILLLVSVHKFFRSSGDDEGTTKIVVFFAGVYALSYVHCARQLISGIHKELKHKFIAWIGFSILTTLLLFSGTIYALISYWDELIEFHNDVFVNCQTLALIVCLAVFGSILLYCTRIVLLLWKSMHFEEQSHNGSCFKLMRDFGAMHAFSFNNFSRAAAH